MLKRIGTSLILLLVPLLSFGQRISSKVTLSEADAWVRPNLTTQQKLSRTSIMFQFLGTTIVPSLAAEYVFVKREKLSFDIRGALLAYPFSGDPTFSFSLGPQLQYGKRIGRLIAGLGFGTSFSYGKERAGQGQYTDPKIKNLQYRGYFMLGYRAQHKHGFFFEVDA